MFEPERENRPRETTQDAISTACLKQTVVANLGIESDKDEAMTVFRRKEQEAWTGGGRRNQSVSCSCQ